MLPTPVYPIQNVTQVSSVIANVLSATQCPEKCPQKNKRCCVHSMHTAFGINSTMQCCAFAPEMTDVKITCYVNVTLSVMAQNNGHDSYS